MEKMGNVLVPHRNVMMGLKKCATVKWAGQDAAWEAWERPRNWVPARERSPIFMYSGSEGCFMSPMRPPMRRFHSPNTEPPPPRSAGRPQPLHTVPHLRGQRASNARMLTHHARIHTQCVRQWVWALLKGSWLGPGPGAAGRGLRRHTHAPFWPPSGSG